MYSYYLGQYLLLILNSHPSPSRVPDTSCLRQSVKKCSQLRSLQFIVQQGPHQLFKLHLLSEARMFINNPFLKLVGNKGKYL